jgi:hypothetical protein
VACPKKFKPPSAKIVKNVRTRFPIAHYNEATNAWSCRTCSVAGVNLSFAKEGIPVEPHRASPCFAKHETSKGHTDAIQMLKVRAEGSLAATAEVAGKKQAAALRPRRKPHIRAAASLGRRGAPAAHAKASTRGRQPSCNICGNESSRLFSIVLRRR